MIDKAQQFGTFDVENYGDLLYPLVFERMVGFEVSKYSFLDGEAPQNAGYETAAVRSLFKTGDSPEVSRRIVIGGGDLLRTDWRVVAEHYRKAHRGPFHRLRHSLGTTGLVQYAIKGVLPHVNPNGFFVERFSKRWMNYPSIGPFMIKRESLPSGSRICYLSCGVPHQFTNNEAAEVKRALDPADFIYVRDHLSKEKLRKIGVETNVHVAPDLIVLLSDQFDRAEEVIKGKEILTQLGVDVSRPLLCFQSKDFPGFNEEEIARQLLQFRQRTESEVVLLPLGLCHGDDEFLRRLAKASRGILKYADLYSVFDCISVIACSEIFVGTSLHGNVTAFSFGIPALYGPLPVDKVEGFLRVVGLPGELKLASWQELNEKLDLINELDKNVLAQKIKAAKAKVYSAVDQLVSRILIS